MSMVQADSARDQSADVRRFLPGLQESIQNMKKERVFRYRQELSWEARFLSQTGPQCRDHGHPFERICVWILKRSLKRRESIRPNIKFTLCSTVQDQSYGSPVFYAGL